MTSSETQAELTRLLRAGYGLVVIDSFEEKRGLSMAQAAAEKAGLPLTSWSPAGGVTFADAVAALRKSEKPGLLALLGLQLAALTPVERRLLAELAVSGQTAQKHLLALGPVGELPEELQREAAFLTLSPPDEGELTALFEETARAMKANAGTAAADAVAAARGLGFEEARRAFRLALLESGGDVTSSILAEKRRVLARNSTLECIDLNKDERAGLSNVGGLDLLKTWLVNRRKALTPEARAFGLPPPKGLLLLGVQGCGKSLSAKAITAEWKMPLCRLDLTGLFGQGQSPAAALRQTIATVEAMSPIVLWIDELEKVFSGVGAGADASLGRLFGWFVTWLGERRSQVFVVATANDVANLPPELLRKGRFDDIFFVDLPGEKARAEILDIHIRRRGRDPSGLPVAAIAKRADKLSGAELEQLVIAALYLAFSEGRELQSEDLWTALHETVPLSRMYEEKIRTLRTWASERARPAEGRAVEMLQQR